MLIECACGCGELLEEYSKNGYKRRYIHNHHTRNKHLSDETKRKLSEGRKGNKHWMYGKHLSENHKQKISESERGKKLADEHIEKIRIANIGKKHTEASKKKMSEARIGRFIGENSPCFGIKHSDEFKEKIRIANTGRKFSEEHKRRISEANCGKKHTEEFKKKMSKAHKGEKNPRYGIRLSNEEREKISGKNSHMWKGGVSFKPYCPKFNEAFKEKIREKFNRKCFLCNMSEKDNGKKLSVHHVQYEKNCGCDDTLKCEFVPLCNSCHGKTNYNREFWENRIVEKLRIL